MSKNIKTFVLEERLVEDVETLPSVLKEIGISRIVRLGVDIDRQQVLCASIPLAALNGSPVQAIVPTHERIVDIGTIERSDVGREAYLIEADTAFEKALGLLHKIAQMVCDELNREQRTALILASTSTKRTHWMVRSDSITPVHINQRRVGAVRFFGPGLLAVRNKELYIISNHDFRGLWTPVRLLSGESIEPLDEVQHLSRVHGSTLAVTTTRKILALVISDPRIPNPTGIVLATKRGKGGIVQRYVGRLGGDGAYVATVGINPQRPQQPIVTLCPVADDPIREITEALSDTITMPVSVAV